ncbi:MAG: hypothetical protein FJZ04_02415 [Candidatus Moranbacteria bacterium]|nr:hypothetical protein [Candidatus Moranbacteria bacterium]
MDDQSNDASSPPEKQDEPSGEQTKRSLADVRKDLEIGQGVGNAKPQVDIEGAVENKNQPLANPRIQTPNVENSSESQDVQTPKPNVK